MFSIFSHPHLTGSLSAPAFGADMTEGPLPVAFSEPSSPVSAAASSPETSLRPGASLGTETISAFAEAALGRDTQQQTQQDQAPRGRAASGTAAAPAGAARPPTRPPLDTSAGSPHCLRRNPAHLKPYHVDAEWDPIRAQGSGPDADLHLLADQFSAMRSNSLGRYQSSGPTHLEFPLY